MIKNIDLNSRQQFEPSNYLPYAAAVGGRGLFTHEGYNPNLHHSYSNSTLNAGCISAMMNQSLNNTRNIHQNIFDPPQSLSQSFTNSAPLSPNPMTPILGSSPPSVMTLGEI